MPNTTNALIVNISSQEDTTANVYINRALTSSFDSTSGDFFTYFKLPNAGNNIINMPPASIIAQLYIKNVDPAATMQLILTPAFAGGTIPALTAAPYLYPGDVFVYWTKPGNANNGYIALTINTQANAVVEYFIGI